MISSFYSTLVVATAGLSLDSAFAQRLHSHSAVNSYSSSRSLLKNAVATNQQDHRSLFVPDIAGYNLLFQSCKTFEDYDDKHKQSSSQRQFVIFRLCKTPIDFYEPGDCNYEYGEYAVKLEDYLADVVPYKEEMQEKSCEQCLDFCTHNNPHNVVEAYTKMCSECLDECSNIENMEANGYIDATEFARCQMIYDPPTDDTGPFYAGPMCDGEDGSKIKIGVFNDPQCTIPDPTKRVEDYMTDENGYGMKLSFHLLRTVYEDTQGISCWNAESYEKNKGICDNLYKESDKCETPHKFRPIANSGIGRTRSQTAEEVLECDFINTLKGTPMSKADQWLGNAVGVSILASLVLAGSLVKRSRRNTKEQPAGSGGMESRGYYELISIDGSEDSEEK